MRVAIIWHRLWSEGPTMGVCTVLPEETPESLEYGLPKDTPRYAFYFKGDNYVGYSLTEEELKLLNNDRSRRARTTGCIIYHDLRHRVGKEEGPIEMSSEESSDSDLGQLPKGATVFYNVPISTLNKDVIEFSKDQIVNFSPSALVCGRVSLY